MPNPGLSIYWVGRSLVSAALGFYFSRIERFHAGRVPRNGPVLFTSNHPNSLTDAFIIGASVPRKVNFVATVRLFQFAPLRWLLTCCGVIPINRVKDDPRAMRSVMETFEACFRVLERGEAIGIFPEGITHSDPQLKTVKAGAARMALELEHRHAGRLGLQILPVGLTFSAREIYRSEVLVNFGEPIRAADYLAGYAENKHHGVQQLTGSIEQGISSLILHLPELERARIVEAVKRLYLDELLVGNRVIQGPMPPKAGELLLTQTIARAVDFTYHHYPERAAIFARKLGLYESWLQRLNLTDEELTQFPNKKQLAAQSLAWTLLGILVAPVAAYGWLHRAVPIAFVRWAVRRFGNPRDKTQVSTTAMLAGAFAFASFYAGCAALFGTFFGWPRALWYALSLPAASLVAHYYARSLRRMLLGLRAAVLLLRARSAARRLLALRGALIAEIETARWEVPEAALAQTRERAP